MSTGITRRRKRGSYTNIDNGIFDDRRLTPEALGLLTYLLSRPDNWTVRFDQLRARFSPEAEEKRPLGRDKLQSMMKLLRECGYATLERVNDPKTGAIIGSRYVIDDEPITPTDTAVPDAESVSTPDEIATLEADCDAGDREPAIPVVGRQPPLPADGKPGSLITTERKQTPLSPPGGTDENLQSDSKNQGSQEAWILWRRFSDGYPWEPQHSRDAAERAFLRLPSEEQQLAVRFIPRYRDDCRTRHRFVKEPSKWLRGKCWQGFDEQDKQSTPLSSPPKIWVMDGTPAWDAWTFHFAAQGKRIRSPEHCKGQRGFGWWFESEFPPPMPLDLAS